MNAHNRDAISAYREDVRRRPRYHDGSRRPDWDALSDIARESWRRNPTPRNWESGERIA